MGNMSDEKQSPPALEQGIHTDFGNEMTYGDYLQLEKLLSSQHPVSGHHDEMLFIVIHQSSELWMKLILHELYGAVDCIRNGNLNASFKMLSRVSRVQQQLIQSWDVLSTLTPADYLQFRDQLGHSSGFQSYQNRLIEFALGYKNADVLKVFRHQPQLYERMAHALHEPSIYDVSIQALAARGIPVDGDCLERDWAKPHQSSPSVEQAWLTVYRDVEKYWDLYELAEKLVDLEDRHQHWRFSHMLTVERIIGHKQGTGGSSGVTYLKGRLNHRFFPELWQIRTQL